MTLAMTVMSVTTCGISLRQVSEMAITAIYPHTPQTVLMSALIVTAIVGASLPLPGLVWMGTVYIWPAVIGLLLVLAGNLPWGQCRW